MEQETTFVKHIKGASKTCRLENCNSETTTQKPELQFRYNMLTSTINWHSM